MPTSAIAASFLLALNILVCNIRAAEHRVPSQHKTIQSAIDAAQDGDVVIVAPGVYHEALRINGKSIQLGSQYIDDENPAWIRRTVLDGSIWPDPDPDDDIDAKLDQVIYVADDVGPETSIIGFTIRDGDDGIACHASINIHNNRFVNNTDGIDYEGGGGRCWGNMFVANDDDGVDLDLDCAVVVENNEIYDNDDDGIEIRLHEYQGKVLDIIIRNNRITGNGEDGIQIIDYPDISDRQIQIYGNVIAYNAMAGIGCMSDGNTLENYEAASIPEPMVIHNNTIAENQYGITGGDNAVVLNNIFVRNPRVAALHIDGRSRLSHNLFWKNGRDDLGSNQLTHNLNLDPCLDGSFRPCAESPVRNAGLSEIKTSDGTVTLPAEYYTTAGALIGALSAQSYGDTAKTQD